jgi:hypothetical protein
LHLAEQLLARLSDAYAPVSEQAEEGLAVLLNVAPGEAPLATSDRAAFWRARFEQLDRDRLERIARSVLSQAMTLEQRGRGSQALQRYRRVIDEFPATQAALEATARLRRAGG